jgi:surface carbohydrate biosynthesis protein
LEIQQTGGKVWISFEAQRALDVGSLVGVAAELNALGFVVSFHSGQMGELQMRQWLAQYQPDVLVLRGVPWGHRLRTFFDQAGHEDYRPLIVVIPAEYTYSVFPTPVREKAYTNPEFSRAGDFVDLVLSIHDKERNFILKNWDTIGNSCVKSIGLPTFDRFVRQGPNTNKAPKIPGIPEKALRNFTVLIASRSATSSYGTKQHSERMMVRAATYYGTRKDYTEQQIAFHVELSQHHIDTTRDLARNFPNISFLFKPHPVERLDHYCQALKGIKNVVVIDSSRVALRDVIKSVDLLIGYRCGSFLESFLSGVPSVNHLPKLSQKVAQLEGPALLHPRAFDNLPRWTVSKPHEVIDLVKKVSSGQAAEEYLTTHSDEGLSVGEIVGELDGQSSMRAAKRIANLLEQSSRQIRTRFTRTDQQKQHLARAANRALIKGQFQPHRFLDSPGKWLWQEVKNHLRLIKRSCLQMPLGGLSVDVEQEIADWAKGDVSSGLIDDLSKRVLREAERQGSGSIDIRKSREVM